jgi:tripartite-type tricarboxylate transporter receptor subunit TctC
MNFPFRLLALGATWLLAAPAFAQGDAQGWPTRPVKMIAPFAPGGPVDIIARLVGQKLTESLGQQMIIENRPGAGGNIGTGIVAKSAPDGYTALVTSSAFVVNVSLFPNPGYDAHRDFAPVIVAAKQPNVIFVSAGVPARTLGEFLAYAKKTKPGFASPGSGTTPHLTAETVFRVMSGLDMTAIHFKGAGPSAAAVVAGEPPVGCGAISGPLPYIKSGKLRALAVSSAKRVASLPDVPTLAESGFPGIEDYTWVGILFPAGTPSAIVNKLNAEANRALQSPDLRERFTQLAFEPVGGSPQDFAEYIKVEIPKWGKVVQAGHILPD